MQHSLDWRNVLHRTGFWKLKNLWNLVSEVYWMTNLRSFLWVEAKFRVSGIILLFEYLFLILVRSIAWHRSRRIAVRSWVLSISWCEPKKRFSAFVLNKLLFSMKTFELWLVKDYSTFSLQFSKKISCDSKVNSIWMKESFFGIFLGGCWEISFQSSALKSGWIRIWM